MANTVRLKRSAVQGKAPVVGDLALGELAVNTYDGKLYTKKNDGSDAIVEIGENAVTSVNTLTGAVSLGVEDLDDYLAQATPPTSAYHASKQSSFSAVSSTTGGWAFDGFGYLYVNLQNPTSGTSLDSQGFIDDTTLDLWVSADGVNFTQHTATSTGGNSSAVSFNALSPDLSAYSSATALYFSLTSVAGTLIALADGDILQYESATSKFRPVQLGADDLSDVDTTTAAPTDGQALVWDNTAQKWEPGNIPSAFDDLTDKTITVCDETVYSLTGTDLDGGNGPIQYKTLTANTTFTSSMAEGESITLMLDDGASAYTATWPTMTWVGGSAPSLPTTGYAVVVLWVVNGTLYGSYTGDA